MSDGPYKTKAPGGALEEFLDLPAAVTQEQSPMPSEFEDLSQDSDGDGNEPLRMASLSASEQSYHLFTFRAINVKTHWLKSTGKKVICLGDGCPLCEIGDRAKGQKLLPALDLMESSIMVLAMSDRCEPGDLLPGLKRAIKRSSEFKPLGVHITRNNYIYEVKPFAISTDVDICSDMVKRFQDDLDAGLINLALIYTSMSAMEIKQLSEVKRQRQLRGLHD